MKMNIDSLYKN